MADKKSSSITELISLINSDDVDLSVLTIYFKDNFEINYDHNDVPMLWKGDEFWGHISFDICSELLEKDGITFDGDFLEFDYFHYLIFTIF